MKITTTNCRGNLYGYPFQRATARVAPTDFHAWLVVETPQCGDSMKMDIFNTEILRGHRGHRE